MTASESDKSTARPAKTPLTQPGSNVHSVQILNELGFRYDAASLYHQTISAVLRAAELLDLPHHLQLILAQPKTEIITHFPVRMDNGQFKLFKGYRVQHNSARGICNPMPPISC